MARTLITSSEQGSLYGELPELMNRVSKSSSISQISEPYHPPRAPSPSPSLTLGIRTLSLAIPGPTHHREDSEIELKAQSEDRITSNGLVSFLQKLESTNILKITCCNNWFRT